MEDTDRHNLEVARAQLEDFARMDAQRCEPAYLSSDGAFVELWTGETIARVSPWHTNRVTGLTPSGGEYERIYIRATDLMERHWSGAAMGHGMLVRLRRVA